MKFYGNPAVIMDYEYAYFKSGGLCVCDLGVFETKHFEKDNVTHVYSHYLNVSLSMAYTAILNIQR